MEAILTLHLFFIIHIHVRLQHHADWKPFHQLVVITLISKRWFEDLSIPSRKKEWDEMWREADKGLKLFPKNCHFTCQNLSNAPKHVLNHAQRLLANAANASQIRLHIRFHNLLVHLKVARNLGDCMVEPEISSCIKKTQRPILMLASVGNRLMHPRSWHDPCTKSLPGSISWSCSIVLSLAGYPPTVPWFST